MPRLRRPWEIPGPLQLVDLVPQVDEHLVGDVFGARDLQGRDIRLTGGDERVALRAERGDDDVGDPHARLRGHEEREPLVLDLLQAPDRGAARRIAISEEAPASREPLCVLRVAAEDTDSKRPLGVATDVLGVADPLP